MTTADEQPATDAQAGHADAPIRRVTAENEIEHAYHDLGAGDVPLVLLQHFRGNLDNWDPALIDDLAATRDHAAASARRLNSAGLTVVREARMGA